MRVYAFITERESNGIGGENCRTQRLFATRAKALAAYKEWAAENCRAGQGGWDSEDIGDDHYEGLTDDDSERFFAGVEEIEVE